MHARILLLISAAVALSGCGASDQDKVKAKVIELGQAAASGDYRKICDDVLAPSLVSRLRSFGISCEHAMKIAFTGVRNPAISVGAVTVKGRRASVVTLSMAANQHAAFERVGLVQTANGWRIASLRPL